MPLQQDLTQQIVNVRWGQKTGCRFAVCGYGADKPADSDPIFFGVGAYSDDGKTWTNFRAFENGSIVSIFHMRDPRDKTQTMVIVGGCTNTGGDFPTSTASLQTILGSGPSAHGGSSTGRNVADYGSIGYDKKQNQIYAVENSGATSGGPSDNHAILHTYPIGTPDDPDESGTPDPEPSIFWVGPPYPDIGPVYSCEAPMTFKGKDGVNHTLNINFDVFPVRLEFDGKDITPPGSRGIGGAAGGMNDDGEIIIIATGYHLIGTDDHAIAWWSKEGKDWTEISGIWSGTPSQQTPLMACAVPNPPSKTAAPTP